MSDARGHRAHLDVGNPGEFLADKLQAALQFFLFTNWFPLKWRVGFGYESIQRRNDLAGATEALAGFKHAILDALNQHNHFFQIFISFGRQANHHVELDGQHAAIEYRAADIDDLVVRQILVDDAPQAIGSSLRSDSNLLIPRFNQRVKQLIRNLIETQRRNRDAIIHRPQALKDFANLRMIANRGRH